MLTTAESQLIDFLSQGSPETETLIAGNRDARSPQDRLYLVLNTYLFRRMKLRAELAYTLFPAVAVIGMGYRIIIG